MFLLICLTSVYTLKPTGTSFESNWTWICEILLTFEKWSKNVDFFGNSFFSNEMIGLKFVFSNNDFKMIMKGVCEL